MTTKPFSITIIAPAYPAFQEVCAHVRNGYVIDKDRAVEITQTGQAIIHLILGNPDETAIAQAKDSSELATQLQQAQWDREVKQAAKALIEQEKRTQLEKQVADAVAASEKAIAKLRKDAAGELAKLS